jgi:predicted hydrocarbon binding protein
MFDIRKIQEQVIYQAVKDESNDSVAKTIVSGPDDSTKSEDNPAWVKATMERLENHFDQDTIVQIRRNCQCGYGMDERLALVTELVAASTSLEEFGNLAKANAAGLFSDQGELYLQFPFCPCPMLEGVDRLENDTWCQCTTGYSQVLFEKAFQCQVEVELLKSIKMGDDKCLMKIMPEKDIWK